MQIPDTPPLPSLPPPPKFADQNPEGEGLKTACITSSFPPLPLSEPAAANLRITGIFLYLIRITFVVDVSSSFL